MDLNLHPLYIRAYTMLCPPSFTAAQRRLSSVAVVRLVLITLRHMIPGSPYV